MFTLNTNVYLLVDGMYEFFLTTSIWSKKDPNHILNDKDLPKDLVIPLK